MNSCCDCGRCFWRHWKIFLQTQHPITMHLKNWVYPKDKTDKQEQCGVLNAVWCGHSYYQQSCSPWSHCDQETQRGQPTKATTSWVYLVSISKNIQVEIRPIQPVILWDIISIHMNEHRRGRSSKNHMNSSEFIEYFINLVGTPKCFTIQSLTHWWW